MILEIPSFKWLQTIFSFLRKKKTTELHSPVYANMFPFPESSFPPKYDVAHEFYKHSCRYLGIYHEHLTLDVNDPIVSQSSHKMLSMLDAAWGYHLLHPEHWYIISVRAQEWYLSKVDVFFCHLGFCQFSVYENNIFDVVYYIGDASVPCYSTNWVDAWLQEYVYISAQEAFEKALSIFRSTTDMAKCRAIFPNIALISWLDHALSLGKTLNPALVAESCRNICIRQHIQPYTRSIRLDSAHANIDAFYARLQAYVSAMDREDECVINAIEMDSITH